MLFDASTIIRCVHTSNIPIVAWSSGPPVLLPPIAPVVYAVLGEPLVLLCRHVYHNQFYEAQWTDNKGDEVQLQTDLSPFCVSWKQKNKFPAGEKSVIVH